MDISDSGDRALDEDPASWLLCRLGKRLVALALENVSEIMRPLPIEAIAEAPRFVSGLSIIRGAPVPVVDAALLFGERDDRPRRWVIIETGGRRVALAVDDVLGVRAIGAMRDVELPPLLHDALGDIVSAIGTLDAELLLFLSAARIVPFALHQGLAAEGAAP